MKFIITNKNQKVIIFQSNIKPEVGEILHLPHQGGYQVLEVVHHVSDDCGHANDELMWIELICKKVEKKEEEDNEIRVGDEVILNAKSSYGQNKKAVIISLDDDSYPYHVMIGDGSTEWIRRDVIDRKTGRNFSQIVEVLKKLREGE